MGSTINKTAAPTGEKKAYVHKARIASFKLVKGNGKDRVFEAVNKHAVKVVKKVGKKKYVTAEQLRPFQGYYKLRVYTEDGTRKAVRV